MGVYHSSVKFNSISPAKNNNVKIQNDNNLNHNENPIKSHYGVNEGMKNMTTGVTFNLMFL